jgi:hypothetical protein
MSKEFKSFYKYSARKPTLSLDRGMNGGHG